MIIDKGMAKMADRGLGDYDANGGGGEGLGTPVRNRNDIQKDPWQANGSEYGRSPTQKKSQRNLNGGLADRSHSQGRNAGAAEQSLPPKQSIHEVLFKTKSMFREQMLQNFSYIKELCAMQDTTSEAFTKTKEYERMMDDIVRSDKLLYPPNSQNKERARMKSASESFVKFQDLLQAQIEQAFRASGLVGKCLELERLNSFLYQLLVDVDHLPGGVKARVTTQQRRTSSPPATNRSDDEDQPANLPDQGIIKEQSYFDQHYELLKVEVLKRLKKDLHLQSVNWHPKQEGSSFDHHANREKLNGSNWRTNYQCMPEQLIKDEDLFKTIRKEVVGVLEDQNSSYQIQYDKKVQQIQNINYELRKSCLRELHLMRQTYFLRSAQHIDPETALKYSKVQLFQFDEGLDEQICDLLNTKIKQITVEFVAQITEQQSALERSRALINRYQALSPKTFKLAELTLLEVFEGLARIHTDSFEIFQTLLSCYPPNYFVGVIEDTFGAFFDDKGETKLHRQVERIQHEMRLEVAAIAEQVKLEKAKFNSVAVEQSAYILDINRAHAECEGQLAQALEPKIKQAVEAERVRLALEHKLSSRLLEERCERNKQKYNKMKALHSDNECRLAFFKWKVLMSAMKKMKATGIRELMKTLTNSDRQKLKNSLEARDQKNESLRSLLETTQQQLFTLQKKYDEVYAENLELQMKYDSQQSAYSELFHRTHSILLPKITELEQEKQAMKEEMEASFRLVQTMQTQQILIEEKYNIRAKKEHVDPKERVLLRIFNEFGIQQDAANVLLTKMTHKALVDDPGLFKPVVPSEKLKRKHAAGTGPPGAQPPEPAFLPERYDLTAIHRNMRDVECQTELQNVKLRVEISGRDDHLAKCAHHVKPSTREIEIQTSADWELWEEMVQAHAMYSQMLKRQEQEDFEFQMVNLNFMPKKIRGGADAGQDVFHDTSLKGRPAQAKKKPRAGESRRGAGSPPPDQSLAASKDDERPESRAKTQRKPRQTDHSNQRRRADGFDSENDSDDEARNNRGSLPGKRIKRSRFQVRSTDSEDQRLQQQLREYERHRELIQRIEDELRAIDPPERFDRVRFVFETNIDVLEIIKQKEPQLYKDALAEIKQKQLTEHKKLQNIDCNPMKKVWREALLEQSALHLKRLYPRNQPEVFSRLHKVLDDREFERMKTLQETNNVRWEKKFNSTTGASSDFANLFAHIQRTKAGLFQPNLQEAQKELLFYMKLKQTGRAKSAGRLRKRSWTREPDQNGLDSVNRWQSTSIGKDVETARYMNLEEPSGAETRRDFEHGQAGIPLTKDTFIPSIRLQSGKSGAPTTANNSKSRLLVLKQQEHIKAQMHQQYTGHDPNANKVFVVPEPRQKQSLIATLQRIKQEHQLKSRTSNSSYRLPDQHPRNPNSHAALNLDLSRAHGQALSIQNLRPQILGSAQISYSNSLSNLKRGGGLIQIRENEDADSQHSGRSKPNIILQQVENEDDLRQRQTSKLSQQAHNRRSTSPNAETTGEPSGRAEFTAIYHKDASPDLIGGGGSIGSPKQDQQKQKKAQKVPGEQPKFSNKFLRHSGPSHSDRQNIQLAGQAQSSIERPTQYDRRQLDGAHQMTNERKNNTQVMNSSKEVQYYQTVEDHPSYPNQVDHSVEGPYSLDTTTLQKYEHAELQRTEGGATQQPSLGSQSQLDGLLTLPINLGNKKGGATIKIQENAPTNLRRNSSGRHSQNQQSSCEMVFVPRQSTGQTSQQEILMGRKRGSQMATAESVMEVFGSTPMQDRRIPESQTGIAKMKSRRGQNLQEKKSGAPRANPLHQAGQNYRYPPQYQLQSTSKQFNPNARVKISCKRVRPQTGKADGRHRKLVRYREVHLNSKKSQISELMMDYMKQDQKLSNINFNNQSTNSLTESNMKRHTQPVTGREFLIASNEQRSLTFDSASPVPQPGSELARSDPISAFNKNNKKVSAYMHRVSEPGSPRMNASRTHDSKGISFGTAVPIPAASAFDAHAATDAGRRNMNHFTNTNIMHTHSLLIVENGNGQEKSGGNKEPHEQASSQVQAKYCTTGSVTEARSTFDQRAQVGASQELDLRSNIKIHSLTNAINSPNTHSSEMPAQRRYQPFWKRNSNQNQNVALDGTQHLYRSNQPRGAGFPTTSTARKPSIPSKGHRDLRGAGRIAQHAMNRLSTRKPVLVSKNRDAQAFEKEQSLQQSPMKYASNETTPGGQRSHGQGRQSAIAINNNLMMAQGSATGIKMAQRNGPMTSDRDRRLQHTTHLANADRGSSLHFGASDASAKLSSSQNQLMGTWNGKNRV